MLSDIRNSLFVFAVLIPAVVMKALYGFTGVIIRALSARSKAFCDAADLVSAFGFCDIALAGFVAKLTALARPCGEHLACGAVCAAASEMRKRHINSPFRTNRSTKASDNDLILCYHTKNGSAKQLFFAKIFYISCKTAGQPQWLVIFLYKRTIL